MSQSPYVRQASPVNIIMLKVILALIPGLAVYVWAFGPAILVQLLLACGTAWVAEASMLHLRGLPLRPFLSDLSALLTACLLALSMPPLAPWWLVVLATLLAIVIGKQLFGGLGSNLFNPAMVGFAMMIIAFPQWMGRWVAPLALAQPDLGWQDSLNYIFTGHLPAALNFDAIASATPLDSFKTALLAGHRAAQAWQQPIFGSLGGVGSEWVAAAYGLGGLYLWQQRIVPWQIPVGLLAGVAVTAGLLHGLGGETYAGPGFHLLTGGVMLGAFFIATDPVTAPASPRGRLWFALGIGILTVLIRVFGAYPDGVAFAVLIMNMAAPLLDVYTRPAVFGRKKEPRA